MVKLGPPKLTPAGDLPPKTQEAAHEMIAQALRERAGILNVTLSNVTYDGEPIGSWEISIRKIED